MKPLKGIELKSDELDSNAKHFRKIKGFLWNYFLQKQTNFVEIETKNFHKSLSNFQSTFQISK